MGGPKTKNHTFSIFFDIEEIGGDGEGAPEWAIEKAIEEALDEIWEKYRKQKGEFSFSTEIEVEDGPEEE